MEEKCMANVLKQYFPVIRTREEVLSDISENEGLRELYRSWQEDRQNEFLDFCTGIKGVKILYDSFFKEVMDPDSAPERLEELLSLILEQTVKILTVLPNDSTRIADESSLVVMDIVIELADHSIANVEVQKLGYMFPGQRSACYSADLLLRQYKRVKSAKGKSFSYRDIKKVYTIIFYEHSPKEFRSCPDHYIHHAAQSTDTGVRIDLLQEYVFIPLDIFRAILHNKGIRNKLEAWLTFLCVDSPELIEQLIREYPQFKQYYEEIYTLCRNVEKVMGMFSKELQQLDRNTVQYMIDEMQDELDAKLKELQESEEKLEEQKEKLEAQQGKLEEQQGKLEEQQGKLEEQQGKLEAQQEKLEEQQNTISKQNAQLLEKDAALQASQDEIRRLKALLGETVQNEKRKTE